MEHNATTTNYLKMLMQELENGQNSGSLIDESEAFRLLEVFEP